jgi:hypothetical protein
MLDRTALQREGAMMAVTKKDVEPYVSLVELGYASLWFLSEAMQKKNHGRTIAEVFAETIGKVSGVNTSVFNQGTCLFAAYLLMVVPKEANLKAFAAQVSPGSPLNMDKFTLTDGSGKAWSKGLSPTLNRLRNGIAHANYEMISGSSRIRMWNYPLGSTNKDFQAEVELKDLMEFCEAFEKQWVAWANSLP